MLGLSRTYGRSKGSSVTKTANGLWLSRAREAGVESAASSSDGVRTIGKSANGSRPPLRFQALLALPLAGRAFGIRWLIGERRR